jgi:hypothetical protein
VLRLVAAGHPTREVARRLVALIAERLAS